MLLKGKVIDVIRSGSVVLQLSDPSVVHGIIFGWPDHRWADQPVTRSPLGSRINKPSRVVRPYNASPWKATGRGGEAGSTGRLAGKMPALRDDWFEPGLCRLSTKEER